MGLTTELNAQQLAAIRHASGPACILAGAGTGKTTVIAERFQRLVETGTAPGRILVLTFSRQAADEMRLRITSKLSGGYPRLCIGTFHSFCLEHLGRAASAAGLATPAVITDGARQVLLMPILGRISARYYAGIREREFLSDALTFIDRASDELVRPDEGLRLLKAFSAGELTDPSGSGRAAPADHIDRLADLVEAYRLYQEELQRRNALDYGAMVARLVERWRGHPDELARARAAFDQILVDEFQDTNGAQFELVRLLAAPDNRLMVVGDDDQAIYAFRGASDRFIRRFRDFYPDAAIYDLTENHRSHQRILDAANAAIAAAHPDGGQRRLTSPDRPDGPRPVVATFVSQADEAAWIADRIAAGLIGSDRQPARRPRDYAVLCRSADQLAQPIVQALTRRGIPVRMQAGEARRDPVLADALAVLTVAVALADGRPVADPPLNRLLAAALPASEFQAAMAAIRARNVTAAEYLFADAAIRTPGEAALAAELTDLAAQLPADQVYQAIRLATRWAGTAAPAAWPALRDLATAADACLRAGGTLADFLAGYTPPPTEAMTADAVAVMTVHAAKGLQFPVTFVAGLSAGIFPVAARLAPVFDFAPLREWLDGQGYRPRSESERQNAQLLEERRLFYVALTRAKEELYLSGAGTYGTLACEESPFIAELTAAGVVDRLAGASARPSAADLVGSARAYLLDLAEGRPVGTAPGVVLKRGLAARSILGAGAGAVDLVPSETAAPFRPGQGLRTSVSALETYDNCPRQFFFVHCLKLPSEAALPMSFGNALHGVLASLNNRRAERGALPSEDELLAWWRARLAADVFVSKQQYRQYLSRGETYLRRYLTWEAEQERRLPGRQVHAVEKQFRFDYRDADGTIHEFRGRFDLILRLPDGSFEIIDYKSGQRRNINKQVRAGSRNNPDRSWQLAVYHLALADEIRADEPNPVISTTYCFLAHPGDDFGLPPAAFNDRGENVITCRHCDASLAVVRGEIDAVLRRIANNDFVAKPREPQVCEWCQFKQLCEVSKHEYR